MSASACSSSLWAIGSSYVEMGRLAMRANWRRDGERALLDVELDLTRRRLWRKESALCGGNCAWRPGSVPYDLLRSTGLSNELSVSGVVSDSTLLKAVGETTAVSLLVGGVGCGLASIPEKPRVSRRPAWACVGTHQLCDRRASHKKQTVHDGGRDNKQAVATARFRPP